MTMPKQGDPSHTTHGGPVMMPAGTSQSLPPLITAGPGHSCLTAAEPVAAGNLTRPGRCCHRAPCPRGERWRLIPGRQPGILSDALHVSADGQTIAFCERYADEAAVITHQVRFDERVAERHGRDDLYVHRVLGSPGRGTGCRSAAATRSATRPSPASRCADPRRLSRDGGPHACKGLLRASREDAENENESWSDVTPALVHAIRWSSETDQPTQFSGGVTASPEQLLWMFPVTIVVLSTFTVPPLL